MKKLHILTKLFILILMLQLSNSIYSKIDPWVAKKCNDLISNFRDMQTEFNLRKNYYTIQNLRQAIEELEQKKLDPKCRIYINLQVQDFEIDSIKNQLVVESYKLKISKIINKNNLVTIGSLGLGAILLYKSRHYFSFFLKHELGKMIISTAAFIALSRLLNNPVNKAIDYFQN